MNTKRKFYCNWFLFLLIFSLTIPIIFPFQLKAQTEGEGSDNNGDVTKISIGGTSEAAGVNCFDYYHFGSVKIFLHSDRESYTAGETVKFSGSLVNENDYPLPQSNLYVQLLRENEQENQKYGHHLIAEKFAVEDIYLPANSERRISFEWPLPAGISSGNYRLASFLTVARQFNVSGLSFLDNTYGGIAYFKVRNEQEKVTEVIFDRQRITLNNQTFQARTFVPHFKEGEKIILSYPVKNLSYESQNVTLTQKLYRWDNLKKENLLSEKNIEETLTPQGNKTFQIEYENLASGAYQWVGEIKNSDSSAVLKIRFGVSGNSSPGRLNFAALSQFPLVKNQPAYIFSCFHSTTDTASSQGKVVLNLKDKKNNKVLAQEEFSGLVTPQIMAFKKDFTPAENYNDLELEAVFYNQENKEMDKVNLNYSCSQIPGLQDFRIEVLKNKEVSITPLDACGKPIEAQMTVEVRKKGETSALLFEPSFKGNHYRKEVNFETGAVYQIKAVSGSVEGEFSYQSSASSTSNWLGRGSVKSIILIVALAIILLASAFLVRRIYLGRR